jgi:riboflavin biosynthesis pyrimidine reductase
MRPKIICHMASSIDGRLRVGRWTPLLPELATNFRSVCYEDVASRFKAEGFIIGRKSMAEFSGISEKQPDLTSVPGSRQAHCADRGGRELAIVVDRQGSLHYESATAGGGHIVAILGEQVSDAYLEELRSVGVSYLFAGPDGNNLPLAMDTLGETFGIKTILLEGGGIINGSFLKAELIDEISILVYPTIDGLAGMPSTFEYLGQADERPAAGRMLRHFATETLEGGVVWLRYRVDKDPALQ